MTTLDEQRVVEALMVTDRLEWCDKMPHSLTARRYTARNGRDLWVATKCGAYLGLDALLTKHREMAEWYEKARVIRFSVSEFDWVERAERNGYRIA